MFPSRSPSEKLFSPPFRHWVLFLQSQCTVKDLHRYVGPRCSAYGTECGGILGNLK